MVVHDKRCHTHERGESEGEREDAEENEDASAFQRNSYNSD